MDLLTALGALSKLKKNELMFHIGIVRLDSIHFGYQSDYILDIEDGKYEFCIWGVNEATEAIIRAPYPGKNIEIKNDSNIQSFDVQFNEPETIEELAEIFQQVGLFSHFQFDEAYGSLKEILPKVYGNVMVHLDLEEKDIAFLRYGKIAGIRYQEA